MNVSYRPNALQRQRLLVLVLIVVVLTYLGSTAVFRDALYYLLVMAKTAVANHPGQGALLFVLYAALAAMFAFVSSSVLIPFAIYAWGQETAFLLLWTGWLVGGMAAYCIGRFLGRPIVIWLTSAEKVAHYEPKINAKAKFTNVLLFQLAVPSEIPGYVLGLLGYSFWRYLLILAFTELPYAVAATFLGDALIQGQMIRFALVSVGGIFVLAYALRSLYRLLGDSDPQESPAKNGNGSGSSPKS